MTFFINAFQLFFCLTDKHVLASAEKKLAMEAEMKRVNQVKLSVFRN